MFEVTAVETFKDQFGMESTREYAASGKHPREVAERYAAYLNATKTNDAKTYVVKEAK